MTPQLGQRSARQAHGLGLAQACRYLGLAARHQHHGPGLLFQPEGYRIIGRRVAGVQGRDHIELRRHEVCSRGLGHRHIEKLHALEAKFSRQLLRRLHQRRTRLDTENPALSQGLEIQVVKNEPQIGLARTMVSQCHGMPILGQLCQQRLDELIEVIDLLELAARILVELSLARQNMQGLEQLKALAGLEPQLLGDIRCPCFGGLLQALLFIGLTHHFSAFV